MKLERQKNDMAEWNSKPADQPETRRKRNNNLNTIKSAQGTPSSSAANTNANLQAWLREAADGHGTNPRHRGRSHQLRAVPRTGGGAGERSQARAGKRHGRKNPGSEGEVEPKTLTIALAGNANVGKSVIFNHLTGLHQHIGNWPGKTVEKAEGTLYFKGYMIDVIDLPGIYSLSTFSLEEIISREYIAFQKPDLVINVVDASVLERNLFFTLQLMELEAPMIIALNQMDVATKKGIEIDYEKLSGILGVPVVPTVAVRGTGVYQLLEKAVEEVEKGASRPVRIRYGQEIEERIEKLSKLVEESGFKYPARWTAIKLLEGDREIEKQIRKNDNGILKTSKALAKEVEKLHGHSCETVVTSERYESARCIASQVQKIKPEVKRALSERIHELTTHRIYGYLIMMGVLLLIFFSIFTFGDIVSTFLGDVLFGMEPAFEAVLGSGTIKELVWGGIMEGIIGGVTIALPYIVPFYLALYLLEDSGYLSRIAYLMDSLMHVIGLHGKAFIPVILSFGCNVPACLGCRIMETKREQLLAVFVVTLIPCAAVTVVVLGLVGRFVSIEWALALYVINMAIVLILGRLAFKALPGEPTGLIMEMNEYRIPHLKTVLQQTWFRLKEFIIMAFPLIILSTFVVKLIGVAGFLPPIAAFMTPITVGWLGLRPEMGISLFFGVIRKELTLVMLAALLGSNLAVLTPIQMVVFTLVVMLYIPCVATIAALVKEIGLKKAIFITVFEILFALLVGGIAFRILSLAGMP